MAQSSQKAVEDEGPLRRHSALAKPCKHSGSLQLGTSKERSAAPAKALSLNVSLGEF